MAKKQRKPVEQNPPTDEVEQDSTAVEETGGKQEEIVKAPSSSPTVSVPADVDSEAKSKKNKKRSKKKKAETSSAAAAVTSPKTTKKNKKLLVKEDSFIRDVIPKEKPTKKPVEQEQPPTPPTPPPPPPSVAEEKEESGGTHEQEKLVFKAPTPSPAASPAMADSESVPETETQEKEETESKKRPLEEGSPSRDEDTKRVKTEEKTKTYFQRLWSEEDEIVLLREIITFGSDQLKDKSRFLESVKSKISFEFTLSQLGSKIETLKRNFREKEHKEVVVFKKPHDQIRFELSKQIWGSSEEEEKKKMKTAHGGQGWFESSFLLGSVASSGLGEETAKELWSLVSVEKKEKLEEEFRLFVAGEVRSMMRMTSLVSGALSAIDEVTS